MREEAFDEVIIPCEDGVMGIARDDAIYDLGSSDRGVEYGASSDACISVGGD